MEGAIPGANGARLQEKEVNLDIALQAGEILAQRGFEVAYTRDDDTYLTLSERCQIATELNAAVFVSVHCNSAEKLFGNRHRNLLLRFPGGSGTVHAKRAAPQIGPSFAAEPW